VKNRFQSLLFQIKLVPLQGGIASVAAGLGGACGAVTGDGGLLMFGAPVTHLGAAVCKLNIQLTHSA
jgi:hypothetical protein